MTCLRNSALMALLGATLVVGATAQEKSPPSPCYIRTNDPVTYVSVPGHPFGAAVTKDGCWIFVSLTSSNPRTTNGIALLRRDAGVITVKQVFPVESGPTGLVLTHDNKLLIVADNQFVVFMDVAQMIEGKGDPIVGFIQDGRFPGSVYVNVTADDKFLFVSDEAAESVTVINLEKARSEKFQASAIVGKIPVGEAPIALTFSPDEKLLYTTSEIAPKDFGWPVECKPEGQDPATAKPEYPAGALIVVDVERAKTDPAKSVVAKIPAGCSPVRLAISPRGDYVYVTARNSNAMLAFDTAKLVNDSSHSLVGTVPVGAAPVPIAVTRDGKKILIGNSNRFAAAENDKQNVTVIDAAKISSGKAAILGTIPAQGFPREFGSSPDGILYLANYTSNSVEVIDIGRATIQ